MSANTSSEIYVPHLLSVMPNEYSLGVPIEGGAIQVKTATDLTLKNGPRLRVAGTKDEIEIEREDLVELQAVAYDPKLGITTIFAKPVDKLTIARTGANKSPDMWTPVTEGLVITSDDGLRQFLNIIAGEARYKKIKKARRAF